MCFGHILHPYCSKSFHTHTLHTHLNIYSTSSFHFFFKSTDSSLCCLTTLGRGGCLPGAKYFKETPFSNRCQLLAVPQRGTVFCASPLHAGTFFFFFFWFELWQILCMLSYLLLVCVCDCPTVSEKYCVLELSLDLVLPLFLEEDF